jgi:leucyl/phenylalanyl-tRNA--protein transferase
MRLRLPELPLDPEAPFPPVECALRDPDGLLAWGGDLHPLRLVNAYAHGCFPWFDLGQPILWWAPDPRLILRPESFHVSRSLARALRNSTWTVTADTRFGEVIRACARAPRPGQHGTWILPAMIDAYEALHRQGHAHSVEINSADGQLVGGIYGVAIGRMFFGESMFSGATNGSKVALLALCRHLQHQGFPMIDCQMETAHLMSLGATSMPRSDFLSASRHACSVSPSPIDWRNGVGAFDAAALVLAPA